MQDQRPNNGPLFKTGIVLCTPGALELFKGAHVTPLSLILRHTRGDFGNVNAEDRKENLLSIEQGFRILSSYRVNGQKVWLITEADRSMSTFLLPDEY